MIDVRFLLETQLVPARHLVAQYLDVSKFVDGILELGVSGLRSAGGQHQAQSGRNDHGFNESHINVVKIGTVLFDKDSYFSYHCILDSGTESLYETNCPSSVRVAVPLRL